MCSVVVGVVSVVERFVLTLRSSGLLVFQTDVQYSRAPEDTKLIDVRV